MHPRRLTLLLLIIILPLWLGGCGAQANPGLVLADMSQALSQTHTLSFSADLELHGSLTSPIANDLTQLLLTAHGRADLTNREQLKYIVDLLVRGANASEDTRVGAQVRSVADHSYFRITDINLPLGLPFSLVADSQWYQVSNPDASEVGNVLGSRAWLTNVEILAIREVVAKADFWVPDTVLPDATINGLRSHHFTVRLDTQRLRRFLANLNTAAADKLDLDVERLVSIVSGHTYHLWVTKRDNQLTRLSAEGFYLNGAGNQVDFSVIINLTNFDVPVSVSVPTNTRDFDVRSLFGLPERAN